MLLTVAYLSSITVCLNQVQETLATLTCPKTFRANDVFPPFSKFITIEVECDSFFDECCVDDTYLDAGCCFKYTETDVWLFVVGVSFLGFLTILLLWLFCYRKMKQRTQTTQQTLLASETARTVAPTPSAPESSNQRLDVPSTPPPSYEEATSMKRT